MGWTATYLCESAHACPRVHTHTHTHTAFPFPWDAGQVFSLSSVKWDWLATSLSCIGEGNGNPLQSSCSENPLGQRSLVGYSPRGCKELDTTERVNSSNWSSFVPRRDLSQTSVDSEGQTPEVCFHSNPALFPFQQRNRRPRSSHVPIFAKP